MDQLEQSRTSFKEYSPTRLQLLVMVVVAQEASIELSRYFKRELWPRVWQQRILWQQRTLLLQQQRLSFQPICNTP